MRAITDRERAAWCRTCGMPPGVRCRRPLDAWVRGWHPFLTDRPHTGRGR